MLRAIDSKILCKVVAKENVTESGIIIPEITKPDHNIFEVVSKGSEVSDEIQVGCKVLVSGFQGNEVKHNDEDYKIFECNQILAVVE
jgi:chaperonin GroES